MKRIPSNQLDVNRAVACFVRFSCKFVNSKIATHVTNQQRTFYRRSTIYLESCNFRRYKFINENSHPIVGQKE